MSKLLLGLLGSRVTQVTFSDSANVWTIDPRDDVGQELFLNGTYAGHEINAIQSWLPNRSTVVNVGANIGAIAVQFARVGYRVVAIEPVPSTFEILRRNISLNDLAERVLCVNSAISTTLGQIEMWTTLYSTLSEIVTDQRPAFTIYGSLVDDAKQKVNVVSEPLDVLLRRLEIPADDVALVWCDAQGSEPYVLKTGAGLWSAGVPAYIEIAPRFLSGHGGPKSLSRLAESHFDRFLTRDDLLAARGQPTAISALEGFANSLGNDYSDALLLPLAVEPGDLPNAV
jgi:FkbM family methyltransferase